MIPLIARQIERILRTYVETASDGEVNGAKPMILTMVGIPTAIPSIYAVGTIL